MDKVVPDGQGFGVVSSLRVGTTSPRGDPILSTRIESDEWCRYLEREAGETDVEFDGGSSADTTTRILTGSGVIFERGALEVFENSVSTNGVLPVGHREFWLELVDVLWFFRGGTGGRGDTPDQRSLRSIETNPLGGRV